jgi:hypothetical protein
LGGGGQGSKGALLFGKSSKNFGLLARALIQPKCLRGKSFLVLFCKKKNGLLLWENGAQGRNRVPGQAIQKLKLLACNSGAYQQTYHHDPLMCGSGSCAHPALFRATPAANEQITTRLDSWVTIPKPKRLAFAADEIVDALPATAA